MGKTAGRKKRIIITTAAMLAIGGGAAFAYWTSTATADKTMQSTADSAPITISVGALAGSVLSPGGQAQNATFTVTNPGTGVQKVSTVVATILKSDGLDWAVGTCTKDDFEVSTTVVPTELSANESLTGTVTLKMINRVGVNQNDCKGVEVPLHFTAN
ncbi:hypothetical protein [Pseudarthrobacter sp. DSP2-3-2b1]|uniref:hypothetical protein n=1 Tax=Pseudarthrobacter sp. DSP2-3-2b1 TaxID=2804661 RepID=UPI003CE745C4